MTISLIPINRFVFFVQNQWNFCIGYHFWLLLNIGVLLLLCALLLLRTYSPDYGSLE